MGASSHCFNLNGYASSEKNNGITLFFSIKRSSNYAAPKGFCERMEFAITEPTPWILIKLFEDSLKIFSNEPQ